MRVPGLIHAETLKWRVQKQLPDGSWALARPEPYVSLAQRWSMAWLVFTGRADAIVWKEQ